ncbi:hypothetical protein C6499_04175, partial [Candidatus Poribacteria bacterium]
SMENVCLWRAYRRVEGESADRYQARGLRVSTFRHPPMIGKNANINFSGVPVEEARVRFHTADERSVIRKASKEVIQRVVQRVLTTPIPNEHQGAAATAIAGLLQTHTPTDDRTSSIFAVSRTAPCS